LQERFEHVPVIGEMICKRSWQKLFAARAYPRAIWHAFQISAQIQLEIGGFGAIVAA
jgi:hypothetical protein